jgi:hypothetical protein
MHLAVRLAPTTLTLHLDSAVAEALAAEAARRGQTADELAADLLAAQLPKAVPVRRRLAFAAVGESASERRGATRIATLNRRHFAVVRPRHANAFELLPWYPSDAGTYLHAAPPPRWASVPSGQVDPSPARHQLAFCAAG